MTEEAGNVSTRWLVVIVALNAVIGQLLLKHALNSLGGRAAMADWHRFAWSAVSSPWVYLSVAVQGLGYVLWMVLVSREKMGVVAAGVGAGFYLLMPLAAWAVYGETLGALQWLGMALVSLGVVCVSIGGG